MLLYLKLGKVPDYTIWALLSLVDFTDKSKEKMFGKKTDIQLEENTKEIKEKFDNSIISLQEQQLSNLYTDKYLLLNPQEEKTTLYHDIDKIDKKFQKFLNFCQKIKGDSSDNLSEIIKYFEYFYNKFESEYESTTESPSSVSFGPTKKGGRKKRKYHKTKKKK